MGDVGEAFEGWREQVREHRAKMLAQADTTGWTRHTDYHFSRVLPDGRRVEWWPSGGKARINNRMVYGHRKVRHEFERLGLASAGTETDGGGR